MDNLRDLRYRAYVGPADKYDVISAVQFNTMINLGLRENHFLLDIGCGSLGAGRLFIPYLEPRHYFGVEPGRWLVEEGIKNELGQDILFVKKPVFDYNRDFNLGVFGRRFDFLLAHSIFSHASPSQIKKCLSEALHIMHKESVFVSTFVEGDENYEGSSWSYPSFVTYTQRYLMELFLEFGLSCVSPDWPNPIKQKWLVAMIKDSENVDKLHQLT